MSSPYRMVRNRSSAVATTPAGHSVGTASGSFLAVRSGEVESRGLEDRLTARCPALADVDALGPDWSDEVPLLALLAAGFQHGARGGKDDAVVSNVAETTRPPEAPVLEDERTSSHPHAVLLSLVGVR